MSNAQKVKKDEKINVSDENKLTGVKPNWRDNKENSVLVAESHIRLLGGYENRGYRMLECCCKTYFREYEDGAKQFDSAFFCERRLCPMCMWRDSLKTYGEVSWMMDYIQARHDFKFIFLTLTVKNVGCDKITSYLDEFFEAFNRLTKLKRFKDISKGWFRSFEMTHNWDTGEYHPHFHVIIAVDKSYAEWHGDYMHHSEWVKMWHSLVGGKHPPSVRINRIYSKDGDKKNYKGAVAETVKYTVTSSDLIYRPSEKQINLWGEAKAQEYANKRTDENIGVMSSSLRSRRFLGFAEAFKEARKAFKLEKENKDKDNVDGDAEKIREDLAYILIEYVWNRQYKEFIKSREIEKGTEKEIQARQNKGMQIKNKK